MKTGFKNINLRQRDPRARVSSRPLPRPKARPEPPAGCGCARGGCAGGKPSGASK